MHGGGGDGVTGGRIVKIIPGTITADFAVTVFAANRRSISTQSELTTARPRRDKDKPRNPGLFHPENEKPAATLRLRSSSYRLVGLSGHSLHLCRFPSRRVGQWHNLSLIFLQALNQNLGFFRIRAGNGFAALAPWRARAPNNLGKSPKFRATWLNDPSPSGWKPAMAHSQFAPSAMS